MRQVTDAAGLVAMAQTFDPYRNLYSRSGVNTTKYAFTGEQQDSNGLLFLRARYYSAEMGRFLNSDPSRLEQNPYLYSSDNPIMLVDPSGLLCEYSEGETICYEDILQARYGITVDDKGGGGSGFSSIEKELILHTVDTFAAMLGGRRILRARWD